MTALPIQLLVVEDSPADWHTLGQLLDELGYWRVERAADAATALQLFEQRHPDLVLLDVGLPGDLDGIELAQELNRRRPVPLIFLTAFTDRTTFDRARVAGPFAFLTKPYSAALLAHSMELAIEQYARSRGALQRVGNALVIGTALFMREGGQLCRLAFADVQRIEADVSYVHFYTADRKYTLRAAQRELEEVLPPHEFVRVHRGWLVRLDAINTVDYRADCLDVAGHRVPLGRSYRDQLRRLLPEVG